MKNKYLFLRFGKKIWSFWVSSILLSFWWVLHIPEIWSIFQPVYFFFLVIHQPNTLDSRPKFDQFKQNKTNQRVDFAIISQFQSYESHLKQHVWMMNECIYLFNVIWTQTKSLRSHCSHYQQRIYRQMHYFFCSNLDQTNFATSPLCR